VQSLARADTADIAIPDREQAAGALAHILATGDLAQLSNEQRVAHYLDICASLGLNPRSRPFDWLVLDNRLVLYPNKSCAEQLRRAHQISVRVLRREMAGELFCVTVEGRTPSGRTDESSKYVPVTYWDRQGGGRQRLVGDKLANAYAKAETGAKRRLVLSMVGLAGLPDQDEMTGGRHVVVDGTGAVLDHPSEQQRYLAATPSAAAAIGEPTYESTQATSGARSPLAGTASQAPTEDELAPPERPSGPAPTFKPSAEDVERWNKRWHAIVAGTSYADPDERHRFIRAWTSGRTESLRAFLQTATESQAEELLTRIRIYADEERAAVAVAARVPGGDENDDAEF